MKKIREMIQMAPPDIASERLSFCRNCEHYRKETRQCKLCGCFVHLKVKALASKCPSGMWPQ